MKFNNTRIVGCNSGYCCIAFRLPLWVSDNKEDSPKKSVGLFIIYLLFQKSQFSKCLFLYLFIYLWDVYCILLFSHRRPCFLWRSNHSCQWNIKKSIVWSMVIRHWSSTLPSYFYIEVLLKDLIQLTVVLFICHSHFLLYLYNSHVYRTEKGCSVSLECQYTMKCIILHVPHTLYSE